MTKELLRPELLGTMLSPQTFFTPVEGWVDGVYHAEKKPGPLVQFNNPQAAGMFLWTKNAEDELKSSPMLDPDKLGIERMVYFAEIHSGIRIPWNTGLRQQINEGWLGQNYVVYHEQAPNGDPKVPVLKVVSLFSDSNKIAWIRAFLGWAYRCTFTGSPDIPMLQREGLVRFM